MLYQRKLLPDTNIGDPVPLPAELVGLDDDTLADLSAHLDAGAVQQLGYVGQGFIPVPDPEPAPLTRWLHKAILLQRIPAAKRIAIRTAAQTDPIIEDFLDLLYQTENVDLDNPNLTAGLNYIVSQGLIDASDVQTILA